ncbi:MAG: tryptophan synthase subunit alpha [Gemmataceae bacterium]
MHCTVEIERLPNGLYRASCAMFPDCQAVAATADAARERVEQAIEFILRQTMNPIDSLFQELRSHGRKAFMPFVTAGDPDLSATRQLVRRLAQCGANLVEIGFPYSDPIADGPVIQASYNRALKKGLPIADLFATVQELTQLPELQAVPLVAMVSYSLVYRRGTRRFVEQAKGAGFSGLIVPDLPIEDQGGDAETLFQLATEHNLKLIQLVTPTTPPQRSARIVRLCSGFVYVVSVTGITGERDRLPERLLDQLRLLRQQTDLPLCVGFGVSKPEHAAMLREVADGIIVGSAIIRRLEQAEDKPWADVENDIAAFVRPLVGALNPL